MKDDAHDSEPTWYGEMDPTWAEPIPVAADEPALQVAESNRYAHVRFLGAGSIGTVALCFDKRLGRHVAYKALREDVPVGPSSIQRFLREARINGQLNHPGIVPVFDAGVREDGARFYTMRLVKGRTLLEAMEACRGLEDRLALLDNFSDLCQAMAYAHARGVVHRDLKPANVMLGEFGETQIIDWGLARTRPAPRGSDTAALRETDALADLSDPTLFGTVMGTPRYMSPEQANGATDRIDQRSDVFGLGAMLYELLAGRAPFEGDQADEVLERVRIGRFPPVLEVEPNAPSELAAIAEKALEPDPARRYPSARELAEDIDRWRRGALVGAYAYRPRDHLRRFTRQNRAVLVVVAIALLVILVSGAVSATRIVKERNRALDAEASATERLATSYVLQADAAREAGRWPEAELYAASALSIREDPVARGVIAGSWARPALRLVGVEPGPEDCDQLFLDGEVVGCVRANRFVAWRRGDPSHPLISLDEPDTVATANAGRVAWLGNDELRVYRGADGALVGKVHVPGVGTGLPLADGGTVVATSRIVRLIDDATGALRWETRVDDVATQVVASDDDARLLIATRGEYAFELDASTGAEIHRFGPVPSMASAVGYGWEGDRVLVGAGTGELFAFRQSDAAPILRAGRFGAAITGVFALPGLVLTRVEDGSVRVYDPADGRELAALHDSDGARRGVAIDRARHELITTGGGVLRRWSVDELSRRAEWNLGEGLLDAVLSPKGSRLATLTGARKATLFALPEGVEIVSWALDPAKGGRKLAFTPDGTRVLSGEGGGPIVLRRASDGERMGELAAPARLLAIADGRLAAEGADQVPGVNLLDLATGATLASYGIKSPRDLDLSADGRTVVFSRREDPEILVMTDAGGPAQAIATVRTPEIVTGLSISPDGQRLAWGEQSGDVVLADLSGREQQRLRGHTHLVQRTDWTPDGHRLISASWDGTARVWDVSTGAVLAELRGHQHRVWSASLSADGATLVTGSWDHTARLWDLTALDQPGPALVDAVRQRHGLVLENARPRLAPGP